MLEKILYFTEIFNSTKNNDYIITTVNTSLINISKPRKVFWKNIVFIKNPKDFQICLGKDYIVYKEDEE